jgi:hypothetical protein
VNMTLGRMTRFPARVIAQLGSPRQIPRGPWGQFSSPGVQGIVQRTDSPSVGSEPDRSLSFESFPLQDFETADVSRIEGTIAVLNYLLLFGSPRNGIEEADGSIPFSSTEVRPRGASEISLPSGYYAPPASTRRVRTCCAAATASAFA